MLRVIEDPTDDHRKRRYTFCYRSHTRIVSDLALMQGLNVQRNRLSAKSGRRYCNNIFY